MFSYEFDSTINVLIAIALGAMAIIAALHALLSKRDSKSALAWVAICLLIPFFGPVIYLVLGINRISAKAQTNFLPDSIAEEAEITETEEGKASPLAIIGQSVSGRGLYSADDMSILENGEALFPKMLEDIAAAKQHIYCSTYIFQKDSTGTALVEAFATAQDRGIDVRIIVDGLGGIAYPPKILSLLKKRKINFRLFNPITLIPPSLHVNMRNHRKILVIDEKCAYTGGQNLSDRHLIKKSNNPKCARDLHFRFTGKIVDDLTRAFIKDWNHCCEEKDRLEHTPVLENQNSSEIWTRLILDGPNENLDKLNELLVGTFAMARERLWIMTPYFLPGLDLIGALVGARLRGVDVKVLLPERTNVHLAHWASQHNLKHLLDREIPVYSLPAPFIHTKAILIDNGYSLIGSANLDPRSLRLNFELGLEVFSTEIIGKLHQYFETKLASATRVDNSHLTRKSRLIRGRNALAWLFSPYL